MRHSLFVRGFSLLVLIGLFVLSAWGQVNVLTYHNDNNRTGANLNETLLNTSNVNADQFGKLFSRAVDGQIYAQPLYVSNVPISDKGTRNVVYVATEHNSVYAFDADDAEASDPLWRVNLGPSVPVPNKDCCNRYGPYHDLVPEVGISGTPVIDLSTNTLYVVSFTKEDSVYYNRLHALDIRTGEEKFGGPVVIDGSVPGTGEGGSGGRVPFRPAQNPAASMQRPGLVLANGVLYVAFASYADTRPYHGWVFAYDPQKLTQRGIFCVTPNGREGGIWQSGQAPPADEDGHLYFMTGNGSFTAHEGGSDYGDSFVKLGLSKDGLSVVDYFTPCNQCCLDRSDADLGSAGPSLLPGTKLLVGGGKQGRFYLLNRDVMGQFNDQVSMACPTAECSTCVENKNVIQRFQASSTIFGSPIYWNSPDGPLVYVWAIGDRLKAYKLVDGRFQTTPFTQTDTFFHRPSHPGGYLSLSANGSTRGTGIVWATVPTFGSNDRTVKGILRALDASDLTKELWNSTENAAFDSIGNYAKFSPPTIANGKVYVASFSGHLHVFGLLPKNQPPLVSLTAPTTGTTLTAPANITLRANAINRADSIEKVEFYNDTDLIGTATERPYRIEWKDVQAGSYTLTAVATDSKGVSATSNPVNITVATDPLPIGRIISINFVGGRSGHVPLPMEAMESAGVLDKPHWNNAKGKDGFIPTQSLFNPILLLDDTGLPTGATLSWNSHATGATSIEDTPGNNRMMKGYLDTAGSSTAVPPYTSTTYVLVADLPPVFTSRGYDVYVYFDGDNGSFSKTAEFTISHTTVSGTDAADTDFSGTFTQAIASDEGNYVVFPGLKDDRFILAATPGPASNNLPRAPINGIQIVAHAEK